MSTNEAMKSRVDEGPREKTGGMPRASGLRGSEALVRMGRVSMNEIAVRCRGGHCRVLWDDAGRVVICSESGDWSYRWGDIGGGTMTSFLIEIQRDYMGEKMLGNRYRSYCQEASARIVREATLEERRRGGFSKGRARDEWALAFDLEIGERSFDEFAQESAHGDARSMIGKKIDGRWERFWESLWVPLWVPHVVPALGQWVATR